ncbi:MAG: AsmA family protein [Rhodanobacteraceae bacterium]
MTRRIRIVTWIIGVIVALVVIVIIFIALFDWNRAKPWFDRTLSTAIGRPLTINGDLSVHWSRNRAEGGLAALVPWPRFTAKDVSIANPAWAKPPQFAAAPQVQFSVSPLALLGHGIEVPSLALTAPNVDIERDAQGRDNWTFVSNQSPSAWTLELGTLIFDRGTVKVDDQKLNLHLQISVDELGKPIPYEQIIPSASQAASMPRVKQPYDFGWTAHGTYRGAKADGDGKIGSVLALSDARMPFPLQATLRLRDLHIAFAGTLSDLAHLAAFDLHLKLSGDSMSHLYALTGIALPATPPFSTEGHLTGNLHRHASVFHYDSFNGKVGASDLHGSLTYSTTHPRPRLSGTVASNVLKLSDLAPLIGADSNAEKTRRGDATKQPPDKLLPIEPFNTDRWRAMDADVKFIGKRILRNAALPINDLSTHLKMDDGVLTLDPLMFGIAGGTLDSSIRLDGRADPMKGKLKLSARAMQLKKLFPTVSLMQASLGEIDGDAALSGTGSSVAALAGSSNGEIKLLLDNGAISDTLMEEAGLNIANVVVNKLFGDQTVKINCAAADFVARDGTLNTWLFVFDTEDMTINVDGTANLSNEKLDMTLHPHSKGIRILSLRSPLYLRGTLKNPDVGVKKGPLIARTAGAVALGTVAAPLAALAALIAPSHQQDNHCAQWIAQMQQPASAPPAGKTMPATPLLQPASTTH